jgi:hypothetical protein
MLQKNGSDGQSTTTGTSSRRFCSGFDTTMACARALTQLLSPALHEPEPVALRVLRQCDPDVSQTLLLQLDEHAY